MTQDREEVSDDAYRTWKYYFYNRKDVFKKQLDFSGDTDAPWKLTKGIPDDDCWETASMEHYELNQDEEPWDDVPTPEYIKYVKNSDPLMKTYYKKLKKFIMFSHDLLFQYGVWRQHMVKLQGITQS